MNERIFIHYDMDYFYCQVEVSDNPKLRGKPVVVGAKADERGIVSTCSYEARKYGIRSGMSSYKAFKLCPEAIFVHPHMYKYKEESAKIQEIAKDYSDVIEFVSLDEAFLYF